VVASGDEQLRDEQAADEEFSDAPRADYRPQGTEARASLPATLKRTLTEVSEDNMTDWAAA
jgi:membrane protein